MKVSKRERAMRAVVKATRHIAPGTHTLKRAGVPLLVDADIEWVHVLCWPRDGAVDHLPQVRSGVHLTNAERLSYCDALATFPRRSPDRAWMICRRAVLDALLTLEEG